MKTMLLVFTIFFSISLAQNYSNKLSGTVTDSETFEPLPNVNVYISGTIWGTTTNKSGEFTIKNIVPAEHEIVVSMLGYKPKSDIINVKANTNMILDFSLIPKPINLENVEVISEKPNEWHRDLKRFKRLFLGNTKFAEDCFITNEVYINFKHPFPHILQVSTDRPLQINNFALGFKLICEFINFKYDDVDKRLQYMVKTYFSEMTSVDSDTLEMWEENRVEAFKGSLDHFLISLKKNNFMQESFDVSFSMIPSKDGYNAHRYDIFASDSLLSPGTSPDETILNFPYFLQVEYKGGKSRLRPTSWIKLLYGEAVLDQFGYTKEIVPFETHGYWAIKGLADMLPKYYFSN